MREHGNARRRFLATLAGVAASSLLGRRARADLLTSLDQLPSAKPVTPRSRLLYVIIDRPQDAGVGDHMPNIRGLTNAATLFDPTITVMPLTLSDVSLFDATTLDATLRPLAIFGPGSFSEWFEYARDASWRQGLDHWMDVVRKTKIPMFAVCGSHQLLGLAFNGFSAVAHMVENGEPVPISKEMGAAAVQGMWPNPRVGEEGTYPVVATSAGLKDPLVQAVGTSLTVASHHKDMVVDTTGFTLLYQGDDSRPALTRAGDQVRLKCRVQGLRRDDPTRLLYSTQFHPEMAAFEESVVPDQGYGMRMLHAFLGMARDWWSTRES